MRLDGEPKRGESLDLNYGPWCESPFPLVKSGLVLKCAVEQRLARQAHNLEVVGSIPTGAIFRC